MELRPESSPLARLILLGLGLCAGIAAIFIYQFHEAIIHRVYCPLRTATGVPCPTCGSTHAVVALLQGHPRRALLINPLATSAVILFVVAVMWAAGGMVIPAWRVTPVLSGREKKVALSLAALAIIAAWFYEIWRLV